MDIGIIGLGSMGSAIAYRLVRAGNNVIGFDINPEQARIARTAGIELAEHLPLVAQQARIIWLLLPASSVDTVLHELLPHVRPGDIIIDGGNSYYKDSMCRAQKLLKDEIALLDCGISGGLHGKEYGFCLMVGGDHKAFERASWVCKEIAVPQGYAYIGPSGAGHYINMIQTSIEYTLLQAYAEGFQLLRQGPYQHLDLAQIAHLWNHGAMVRSWLLTLISDILQEDQELRDVAGHIDSKGMEQWTVDEAHAHKLSVPCLEQAISVRLWSQLSTGNYATKLIAIMRNKFGGH
jgi:6-phosphogluconate dehydrogenase